MFGMAGQFQEERIFLGEKSDHMVTVIPFMGKLKVRIRQFYENENREKKPGKNSVTLELEEFDELVKLIPKVRDSIARYELRDTGISSSPFELDLHVLDLDMVFIPSQQSQEPIPIIQYEELLDSQHKCPSLPSTLPNVSPPLINPALENDLDGLNFYAYVPGEKRKQSKERTKKKDKKSKTETDVESKRTSGIFVGY